MKVRYDHEADAAYLYLVSEPQKVAETREVSDEIFIDYDTSGQPVGIEIIGVAGKVPAKTLRLFKSQTTAVSASK